jgi:hypothetical protein
MQDNQGPGKSPGTKRVETTGDMLRDALRQSFEDSLKAPPSARLEKLMSELRDKEKRKRAETGKAD